MSSATRDAARQAAPPLATTSPRPQARVQPVTQPSPVRIGLLDSDGRFVSSLSSAMRDWGWEVAALAEPPRSPALTALRLNALLVDVAAIEESEVRRLVLAAAAPRAMIVACVAGSTVAERVRGLEAGLAGWIDKPCEPQEAIARVQAIVRAHCGTAVVRPALYSGELEVLPDRYDALARRSSAGLTTREFEILELLAKHAGTVLDREQISLGVWGDAMPAGDRSVDIFVSRIRRKLQRISPGWSYLHTHPGLGYRFAAESLAAGRTGEAIEDVDAPLQEIEVEVSGLEPRQGERKLALA
jgi:DNA-binding response OmpR family regulator